MIAALYARYSSDNQRAESITAQLRAGREYCQRHNYTIIREYADAAYTGTNDQRPQYQQMLADARKGMFEIVIFHKVDRSARNEYDYYKHKRDLAACGVAIAYSGQPFDTTTPEGALMEAQMVGMAAYYSRNLSREVKKGLKENVLAGKITGGKPCFGFTVDSSKRYVPDPDEAPAVVQIFSMYADGHGYTDIIAWLNAHGFRTRRGRPFGKNSLHDLLRNRRYIGTCLLGKNQPYPDGRRNSHRADHSGMIIVENGCPAIVDRALFDRVQHRMNDNRHRSGAFRARRDYLLSGRIHCGLCQSSMTGTGTQTHGHVLRYYYCSAKSNHGRRSCPNKGIRADKLESFVMKYLRTVLQSPAILVKLSARVADYYRQICGTRSTARKRLQEEEIRLSRALDNLYRMVEYGEPDAFDMERIQSVKANLAAVRSDLRAMRNAPPVTIDADRVADYIRRAFIPSLADASKAKIIIQSFVHDIVVTPDAVRVQFTCDGFEYSGFTPERTSILKSQQLIFERSFPRRLFVA